MISRKNFTVDDIHDISLEFIEQCFIDIVTVVLDFVVLLQVLIFERSLILMSFDYWKRVVMETFFVILEK